MSDLISRQAAIDTLHGYFDGMLETDTWSPCDVYGLIEILPSVDAVEVVRCEDCKWHRGQWQCLNTDTYGFALDDYCSYGERNDV